MKKLLLLFVIVELSILQECLGGKLCFLTQKNHVHIVNNLTSNSQPLKIHCASGDNDLGHHDLYPGQKYEWGFCPNLGPNTLFFCHFWWGSKNKAFEVYNQKKMKKSNRQSWWKAEDDGIYFCNGKTSSVYMKKYDWN